MNIPGSKKHFCEKLARVGNWEGIDSSDQPTSGPIVQCIECGFEFRITQERWERILIKNKSVTTQKEERKLFI